MLNQQKHSIFISYKKETGLTRAILIVEKLKARGYNVFFDKESLRGGKFDEQLFYVIDKCTDLVLVLSQNALDSDWVRREVCRAKDSNKNIIPVVFSDFEWPYPMPENLGDLKDFQSVPNASIEYMDIVIAGMCKNLIKSYPIKIIHKILLYVLLFIISLSSVIYAICPKKDDVTMCNIMMAEHILSGNESLLAQLENYTKGKCNKEELISLVVSLESYLPVLDDVKQYNIPFFNYNASSKSHLRLYQEGYVDCYNKSFGLIIDNYKYNISLVKNQLLYENLDIDIIRESLKMTIRHSRLILENL